MKKLNTIFALFALSLSVFLTACSPSVVKEGSQVSFSYIAKDPETQELLFSDKRIDMPLDFSGTALFQLLNGAKVGETKTKLLQDPLNLHNPELIYQQTAMVFEEMGVPAEIWGEIRIWDKMAKIVDIVNENGIEQVVLDANPLETTIPLLWEFTITEIK